MNRKFTIATTAAFIFFFVALGVSEAARTVDRSQGARLANEITRQFGPSAAYSKFYVGTDVCLACHSEYAGYKNSMHYSAFKRTDSDRYSLVDRKGVVADYNLNGIDDFKEGLDFNQISSGFDRYKPNAPILGYNPQKGYTVKIGQIEYLTEFAYGGSGAYKQRYLTRIPVTDRSEGLSAGRYVLPIQFNETYRRWVPYAAGNWYDANNQPIFGPSATSELAATRGNNFDRGCSGCHFSGLAISKTPQGEYVAVAPTAIVTKPDDPHVFDYSGDGEMNEITTGCERCHGPGSVHVITVGNPARIINPRRDMTVKQMDNLCGSCHARGTSKGVGTFGFPIEEETLRPAADAIGEDVFDKMFIARPAVWAGTMEPAQHRQQIHEHRTSAHGNSRYGDIGCVTCHDVHNTVRSNIREAMIGRDAAGLPYTIMTKVQDNSACLVCHAGHGPFSELKVTDLLDLQGSRDVIARVVSRHTYHSYRPEGPSGVSRCTECHMSKMGSSGNPHDVPSHTFNVPPPANTIRAMANNGPGMPNGCSARCHKPLAIFFGLPPQTNQGVWNTGADRIQSEWLMQFYGPNGLWWRRE